MNFGIYGPYKVLRVRGLVDKSASAIGAKGRFWTTVEGEEKDLSRAAGCYIFCIGRRPYYVGLAEKQGFRNECFQPTKINAYNYAMSKNGKPTLVLIAKLTNTGRFAKPGKNGHKSIRFLEKLLIGMAYSKNRKIQNVIGTKYYKTLIIPGILNTPKGKGKSTSARYLRNILMP